MKPESIRTVWLGQASSSAKSVEEAANLMLLAAKQHPIHYGTAQLVMEFTQGVTIDVARGLKEMVR